MSCNGVQQAVFVDSRDDDDFKNWASEKNLLKLPGHLFSTLHTTSMLGAARTTRIQTSFHLSANSLIMKAGGAPRPVVHAEARRFVYAGGF